MIGDITDMLARLRVALTSTWFPTTAQGTPTNSPVLDGLLSGVAYVWSQSYSLLQYVKSQARISTAGGVFLDIIASDFFGLFLSRRNAELDASLRTRIKKELLREKGTRAGLIAAVTDLTGRVPTVFEPGYTLDTGGWGVTGRMGYGVAGGYGSLVLPFQFFINALRPLGGGVASVAGYGHIGGFNGMTGGYGVGSIEYVSLAMVNSPVVDQDILNVINDVKPVASIAWTTISF